MKNYLIYFMGFITLFVFRGKCLSQQIDYSTEIDTNLKVLGIIDNGSQKYFVTELGAMLVDTIDPYLDYYRTIYNDSTLSNPNTVIGESNNINFLPVMDISDYEGSYRELENQYYLSDFLEIGSDGNVKFKPGYLWIFNQTFNKTGKGEK